MLLVCTLYAVIFILYVLHKLYGCLFLEVKKNPTNKRTRLLDMKQKSKKEQQRRFPLQFSMYKYD